VVAQALVQESAECGLEPTLFPAAEKTGGKLRMRTGLGEHGQVLVAALTLLTVASHPVKAQHYDVPTTWGGDILSRPRLTGDWGGLRDELGRKGIVLDLDLLTTPKVVLSGGRSTGGNFWGTSTTRLISTLENWGFGRAASSRSRTIPDSAAMSCKSLDLI